MHYNCDATDYLNPKILSKTVEDLVNLIGQISYDSKRLQLDKKVQGFHEDIDHFENIALDLESQTKKYIKKGVNHTKYVKKFAEQYNKALEIKEQLLSSSMYESYKTYIAERRLNRKLFDSAESIIKVMDRNLAPKLREGLAEMQDLLEEQKAKEVEEFKNDMREQAKVFDAECITQLEETLNLIETQQNISELAGGKHYDSNITNQQALTDLIKSIQQQNNDHSRLVEVIQILTKSLIDHIKAYRRVKKNIKSECKSKDKELKEIPLSQVEQINKLKEESDLHQKQIDDKNIEIDTLKSSIDDLKEKFLVKNQ